MSSIAFRQIRLVPALLATASLLCLPVAGRAQNAVPSSLPPSDSAPVASAATSPLPQPPVTTLQPVAVTPATTTTTTVTTPSSTATQTTTSPNSGMVTAPNSGAAQQNWSPEQQKQAAVQAILGDQVRKVAPPVPTPTTLNAKDLLAQGVVVTPTAKEIVTVTKGARANTDRAVYVAADRAYVSKDFTASADLYDSILKKSPSNKTALYGKALALQKSGRNDEALKIYERLSLLDPTNVNAMANYMSLLRNSDPQKAMSRLQNLETQYPDRAALQGQVGLVYADMNDTPNAIRAFTRATALDPNNPIYAFNLGALYDRLGNDKKAGDYYRDALQIAAANPTQSNTIASDAVRDRLRQLSN